MLASAWPREQDAVGKDDRALPGALERLHDVQQEGVVAVLRRRHAQLEAPELVVLRVQPVAPALGREWRVRHREIEGLQAIGTTPVRVGERIALPDLVGLVVVQEHVHPRQRVGGIVHLLPINGETAWGLVGYLHE